MSKKTVKLFVIFLLFLSIFTGCTNKSNEDSTLSVDQKRKDAAYLWDMVSENFVYQTTDADFVLNREEYSRENFIKTISKTKSDREFFVAVASFLRKFDSPHTSVLITDMYNLFHEPSISSEQYQEKLNYWITHLGSDKYQLPLSFSMWNDDGYIVSDSSVEGISRGDIILTINNQPTQTFVDDINDGVSMPKSLTFKFVNPITNAEGTVEYLHDNDDGNTVQSSTADTQSFWTHDLNESIGYLRLATMAPSESAIIDEFFKNIENCDGIIIDVRGNRGGDGAISEKLIGLIYPWDKVTMPMFPCNEVVAINKNSIIAQMTKNSYVFPSTLPGEMKQGFSIDMYDIYTTRHLLHKTALADTPYKGEVVVLQDDRSYSATCTFIDIFQCAELGVTLGTPALGGNGLPLLRIILPNSGIPVSITNSMQIDKDGGIDEIDGIAPNILVENATNEQIGAFLKNNPKQKFWASEADVQYQEAKSYVADIVLNKNHAQD